MSISKYQAIVLLLIFGLVSIVGCYYDNTIINDNQEISGTVSFNDDIITIFNKDCNTSGCHNTGGIKPDLSPSNAYDALTNGNYLNNENPEESELYQWMKGNRSVPMPVSGPNNSYNARILAWIKQGSLNN
jgi:hypothetical protein